MKEEMTNETQKTKNQPFSCDEENYKRYKRHAAIMGTNFSKLAKMLLEEDMLVHADYANIQNIKGHKQMMLARTNLLKKSDEKAKNQSFSCIDSDYSQYQDYATKMGTDLSKIIRMLYEEDIVRHENAIRSRQEHERKVIMILRRYLLR